MLIITLSLLMKFGIKYIYNVSGACLGGGGRAPPPLEIEKQKKYHFLSCPPPPKILKSKKKKKKKTFQILGPPSYEFLDTRLCICFFVKILEMFHVYMHIFATF